MPDIGRALMARGRAWPTPSARERCPGCLQNTKPKKLTICGRCWQGLSDETRRRLQLKDGKAEHRLEQLRAATTANRPVQTITVDP